MQQLITMAVYGIGLVVGVLLLVATVAYLAARAARGRKGTFRPPDFGIEFIEGRPGSGKSFKALGDTLDYIIRDRRPVYTNLPLQWRVFRKYLRIKGGDELARLLYSIDRGHFIRFCDRTDKVAKLREAITAARLRWFQRADTAERDGQTDWAARCRRMVRRRYSDASTERMIVAACGPAMYTGGEANAIHANAVIILDEAHKYFPQEEQRGAGEPPTVKRYLTMLRHQMHLLIVVTQDRMQVSLSFRSLARAFWKVRDRADDPLVWGIRIGHLGVKAFAYCRFTPEQEKARGGEAAAPAEERTVFPWLPSERWKFRLYESFTHAGSRRAQLKALSAARVAAGLNDGGRLEAEERAMEERQAERREARRPHRVARWVARQALRVVVVGTVFAFGRSTGQPAAAGGTLGTPGAPGSAVAVEKPQRKWGKLSGIGPTFVRVSDRRIDLGSDHEGAKLVGVDVRGRRCMWLADGERWLWAYGDERPSPMGREADGGGDLRSRREAAGLVRSAAIPAPGDR